MRSLKSSIKESGCRKPCRYKSCKSVVKNPLSSHCVTLKSKSRVSRSVMSNSVRPMDWSLPGFSVHGILQQEYWSGLPFFLQGIFPTQGLNPSLLHCRQILYHLSTREACVALSAFAHVITVVIYKMRMIPLPLRVRYEDQMRK